MSQTSLRAESGRQIGSRPARRLRREGLVPATLYGKDSDALAVSVGARDLRRALGTDAGLNAILEIDIDGATHTALAREIQRHPYRDEILHVDFVKILLTDRVDAVVSIEYVGDPIGVREEGGIVETVIASVHLSAVVTNIPDSIEINIDDLGIGDSLKVSDLPAIEGVDYLDDEDQTLVTVSMPAAVEAEAAEEELEEGEEAAEGEEADESGGDGEAGDDDGGAE